MCSMVRRPFNPKFDSLKPFRVNKNEEKKDKK